VKNNFLRLVGLNTIFHVKAKLSIFVRAPYKDLRKICEDAGMTISTSHINYEIFAQVFYFSGRLLIFVRESV